MRFSSLPMGSLVESMYRRKVNIVPHILNLYIVAQLLEQFLFLKVIYGGNISELIDILVC